MRCVETWISNQFDCFAKRDHGVVAILFALVLIPVAGIAATAIDYGRASKQKLALEKAGDSAVIEAARNLDRDTDLVRDEIRALLDANLPKDLYNIPFQMKVPSDRSWVEITMRSSVKTTIAGILGVDKLDVVVVAKAERQETPIISPDMARAMEQQLRYLERRMRVMERQGFGGGWSTMGRRRASSQE